MFWGNSDGETWDGKFGWTVVLKKCLWAGWLLLALKEGAAGTGRAWVESAEREDAEGLQGPEHHVKHHKNRSGGMRCGQRLVSGSSGMKAEKLVFGRGRGQAYLCTVSSENCGWTVMCNHKTTGVSKLLWSLLPCEVMLNRMQNRGKRRNLRPEGMCVKRALWMSSLRCSSVKPLPWLQEDRICSQVLKKWLIWGRIKHNFYFPRKTHEPSFFHLRVLLQPVPWSG